MHEPTVAAPQAERPVIPDPGVAADTAVRLPVADSSLADPNVIYILAAEHASLSTTRSLVYNEAFTRAGIFLTFLSMSFVALALLPSAMGFGSDFLVIVAIVFGLDFVIGLLTFLRVAATGVEDLITTQAMNRIRSAYVRIAPQVGPYLSSGTSDDVTGIYKTYGFDRPGVTSSDLVYGFSSSHGLVGIVTMVVAGLEGAVIALLLGAPTLPTIVVALVVSLIGIAAAAWWTLRAVAAVQAGLEVRFPSVSDERPSP